MMGSRRCDGPGVPRRARASTVRRRRCSALLSRCDGTFRGLALVGLCCFIPKAADSFETIVVGGGSDPWQEGGDGIDPEFWIAPQEVEVANSVGGAIDFTSLPGSILPAFVDTTENLALGALARGGSIKAPNVLEQSRTELQRILGDIIDGSPGKAFERKSTDTQHVNPNGIFIVLDLGGRFGVNRIRFYPRNTILENPGTPFHFDYLRGYELSTNDGSAATTTEAGDPVFAVLHREDQNKDAVVDFRFDLQFVRYLELKSVTTVGFEIDELEVFGKGFVPEAVFLSDVIDLRRPALLDAIRWSEEAIGDSALSRLLMRTRVGDDATPLVYTRIIEGLGTETPLSARTGEPLTLEEYDELGVAAKGPVKPDAENWSPWSAPYPEDAGSGTQIAYSRPRRFVQFEASIRSSLAATRSLSLVEMDYTITPLAAALTAEIFPRSVEPAVPTPFTYAVRADLSRGVNSGFDRLVIATPEAVTRVDRIELRDADGMVVAGQDFGDFLAAAHLPLRRGEFGIEELHRDRLHISFPKITVDQTLLQVQFHSSVFRHSTPFVGQALNSELPEARQPLEPGNATVLAADDLDSSSGLAVETVLGNRLIAALVATPNPFTPDGDGINEVTTISYGILKLDLGRQVQVVIFDLSGRPVRSLYDGNDSSGEYRWAWDGTDDRGKLLVPGTYLFRVSVEGDLEHQRAVGVINMVY